MFSYTISKDTALKLLEQRHAEQLFLLTDRSRESLREWLPWVYSITTADDTRNFI